MWDKARYGELSRIHVKRNTHIEKDKVIVAPTDYVLWLYISVNMPMRPQLLDCICQLAGESASSIQI